MSKNKYDHYIQELRKELPIGTSFDILERKLSIGDQKASMFFVDGLVKGSVAQLVISFLLKIEKTKMNKADNAEEFLKHCMPFLDASAEDKTENMLKSLFAGLVLLVVDGLDKVIVADIREYPERSIEEPEKERTLRGAKDGFTESYMTNVALIRRRIRDKNLIFEKHAVGHESKTEVCIVYMDNIADKELVKKIGKKIDAITSDALTVGEQSLIEAILSEEGKTGKKKKISLNPFPRVRYTQRPDVIAAHLTEGKIAVLIDNTPTVIQLPTGIFDFMQDTDDYYFPQLTGNYFRLIRIVNIFVILFLAPVFLLVTEGYIEAHESIKFFIPERDYAIPLFWQLILLEISVDGLKLASLKTPESLGMSLSVIGALILGEFSVESGWFIPQTILVMAVVALAAFTQTSIELGYAIKFARIAMLIGIVLFGFWGMAASLLIWLLVMARTKTLAGTSYLYPLIPYDGKALKRVIFRTQK